MRQNAARQNEKYYELFFWKHHYILEAKCLCHLTLLLSGIYAEWARVPMNICRVGEISYCAGGLLLIGYIDSGV